MKKTKSFYLLDFVQTFLFWTVGAVVTLIVFCILSLLVFPFSVLFENRQRSWMHYVARIWGAGILFGNPFWKSSIRGTENLPASGPCVLVANHQSIVDILLLLATLNHHYLFVAKQELFSIPFIGWHMMLCRYISLNRGDKESALSAMKKASGMIKDQVSILFFPEGTRTSNGDLKPFKNGAFRLAVDTKVPLVPIVLNGTGNAIPKHSWILQGTKFFDVHIGKPERPELGETVDEFKNRIQQLMQNELNLMRKA